MYGPPDEFITAGWYAELDNVLDWTQFNDGARERTTRKLGDKTAVWDPPLEGSAEEIIYNPKIFEKVGVTVPASSSSPRTSSTTPASSCGRPASTPSPRGSATATTRAAGSSATGS